MSNVNFDSMTTGALLSPIDVRDYVASCAASAEEFPKEFELKLDAVKNQGSVGSCVAHTVSEAMEYFNLAQEGKSIPMSVGYIYGNRKNTTYTGTGMFVRCALENAVKYGDVPNTLYDKNIEVPDAITEFDNVAFELAPDAYPYRLSSYFKLTDEASIKSQLMNNGPVVMATRWYKGLTLDSKYRLTKPENAVSNGAHCMLIYGWNEYGWKTRNSWGKNWGNSGNLIIPYDWYMSEVWGITDNISETQRQKEYSELLITVSNLKEKLLNSDANLGSYRLKISLLEKNISTLNSQIEDLKSKQTDSLEREKYIEELTNQIDELKKNQDDIEERDRQIEELNSRIEELKKNQSEEDERARYIEELIEKMKAAEKELSDSRAETDKINSDYQLVLEDINKKNAEIEELNKKILVLEKPYRNIPKIIVKVINAIINLIKNMKKDK